MGDGVRVGRGTSGRDVMEKFDMPFDVHSLRVWGLYTLPRRSETASYLDATSCWSSSEVRVRRLSPLPRRASLISQGMLANVSPHSFPVAMRRLDTMSVSMMARLTATVTRLKVAPMALQTLGCGL